MNTFKVGDRVLVSNGKPRPPARFNRKLDEWKRNNFTGIVEEVTEPGDYYPEGGVTMSNDAYPKSRIIEYHFTRSNAGLSLTEEVWDEK